MIDTEASIDILFNHCYEQINYTIPTKLRAYDHDLYGFDRKLVQLRVIIQLPLELSDNSDKKGLYTSHDIEFLVIDIASPYNAILRQNSINGFEMAISMTYLNAKL